MTSADVFARVKKALHSADDEGEGNELYFAIEKAIPTALNRFAAKIARDARPDIRNLLRKDFTVTITSGTGDLTTAFTAAEPLMIENVMAGNLFVTSGTTPCQWLPDRTQLTLTRPNFFVFYTIDGNTMRTRNTDGSLTSLATTLTITGNYTPSLANVPVQMQDEFVDILIDFLRQAPPEKDIA